MGLLSRTAACAALLMLVAASAVTPAAAQQPPAGNAPPPVVMPPGSQGGQLPTVPPAGGDTVAVSDPGAGTRFIFEREVYSYPLSGRRDPFVQLSALASMGPTFDELVLLSTTVVRQDPARSVASIRDARGKIHNVRRGSVLGNVVIQDIDNYQVVVAVDEFGVRRQETLRLRPPTTGGME